MAEGWIEQHIGAEAAIRPEFRSSLAHDLQAQWQERQTVAVRPETHPVQHRWRTAGWVAAAAALLVGMIVVLDQQSADAPPVDSAPTTSTSAVSTTSTPTTSTPTTSTSDLSVRGGEADLVVPLTGGEVIRPTSIATVSAGGGPGQLSGFNGEFPPLVAALPASLLVVDDIPFSGFTGRAMIFARTGEWDRDVVIDGIEGDTPLWAGAAPNGVLFVAAVVDSDPTRAASIRVTAHRLVDDRFIVVDTATLDDLSETEFHITPDGLLVRDRQIMAIATGLASPPPTAALSEPTSGLVRASVTRQDTGGEWLVDMVTDSTTQPERPDDAVGTYNDGIWYSANVSSDPTVSSRFLALIDSEETSWFRLADWAVVATDDAQLVLARATTTGIELAVLGPAPPDLSPDLLATWPPAPTETVGLAGTPMMLPSVEMLEDPSRLEYESEWLPAYLVYVQSWVDVETGVVLEVRTHPASGTREGTNVTVAPWDSAVFTRSSSGYESMQLGDPSGAVMLWTNGLSRNDLLDIARSLQPRGESAGWDVGNMPENIVAVHEGWEGGVSTRTVRWSNAELVIASGNPGTFMGPSTYGTTVRITDVNGAQAVLFENDVWAAVSWSPQPGITVVFVMNGTAEQAEAAARSIVEVDRATWEAASRDATGEDDGCQSSFFC